MKKNDVLSFLSLIAEPALLMVVGVILLIWPDMAPTLIAKVLGWGVMLIGICFAVSAIVSHDRIGGKVLWALCCLITGIIIVRNPLRFAAFIGNTVGILIVIITGLKSYQRRTFTDWGSIALFAVGVFLIFMPMTASRLVFSLGGLVVLLVGALMLLARLRRRKLDRGDDDPNIIDAL